MRKLVALVAALALALPVSGCGLRDRRDRTDGTTQQQQTPAPADTSSAQADLDELDHLLGDVDQALDDVDAFEASADAD